MNEPLLEPDDKRFSVLPVKYQDLYKMYKNAISCFWVSEEVDLSKDLNDWGKLDDNERHFISLILAFFNCMDGLINENICLRFMGEVQNSEARLFYGSQVCIEGIHQEVYAKLIDTYIKNPIEKSNLFNAITTYPCVQKNPPGIFTSCRSIGFQRPLKQILLFPCPTCSLRHSIVSSIDSNQFWSQAN
jgi:ribonucleotide reductase beta subunit family protein with ferritin-like domain